jgi:hypothetical protein
MSEFISLYRKFTENTESDTRFHVFCALSAVGTILSRKVHFDFGHSILYPNLYVLLVGTPASRKSSAIMIAKNLLQAQGYKYFAQDKSSREKFLLDFEEGLDIITNYEEVNLNKLLDQQITPKISVADLSNMFITPEEQKISQAYLALSEFANFIGQNNTGFATTLTDIYDNPPVYGERLKNSKSVKIVRPCVNILGGVTPIHFVTHLPPELVGQGFMSRVLLVYGVQAETKIPFPPKKDTVLEAKLCSVLESINKLRGEMKFSAQAKHAVSQIYNNYNPIPDARFAYYTGRRHTHLIKLCMIVAATYLKREITVDHVIEANTYLVGIESSMPDALGEYGEGRLAAAMQKLVEVLKESPGGALRTDQVYASVRQELNSFRDVQELILNLQAANKIVISNDTGSIMLNPLSDIKNTIFVDLAKYFPEVNKPRKGILKI